MSDCCECIPNSSIHFNNEPVLGIGRVGFAESTNKLCMNLAYFCENLLAPNTLCKLWRKLDKEEGGGYAMIPLIQKETVEKKNWISDEDILDIIAIAESTPGPIAVNAATFVGLKTCGFWGAFFSTLGVVLPSFVIISVIANVLNHFQDIKAVQYAFFGIRAGVLSLIVKALWSMYKQCPKNIASYFIAAMAFVFAAVVKVNVLYIVIGCAVLGLIFASMAKRRDNQ